MKNFTYDKTLSRVDLFEVYVKHQVVFKAGIKDVDAVTCADVPCYFLEGFSPKNLLACLSCFTSQFSVFSSPLT